jgi:REP-associated tyrosine transposase
VGPALPWDLFSRGTCSPVGPVPPWDLFPRGTCSPVGPVPPWDLFPRGTCSPVGPSPPWDLFPRGARPSGRALLLASWHPGCEMQGMRMCRLPRESAYIGANRYFVTINVLERQPRFTDRQLVETCRTQIRSACETNAFRILADCYMPDHLHLLLEGLTGGSDLRRCIKDAKQRTSYHAVRLGLGRLWQSGYHDRIVRQDEDLARYADYIVQNPVRAGLGHHECISLSARDSARFWILLEHPPKPTAALRAVANRRRHRGLAWPAPIRRRRP